MEIHAGDVVILKSGGPRMTVISITDENALCTWVEKNKTFKEQFEVVTLRKYVAAGPMTFRF